MKKKEKTKECGGELMENFRKGEGKFEEIVNNLDKK